MEFRVPFAEWGSNLGSDDEEALSFCNLPLYDKPRLSAEWNEALRDSNAGSPGHQDFDFDFGCSSPMAYSACPADDLFHQGRLLPMSLPRSCSTESDAPSACSKSNSRNENRILLNEKLQSWRTDSLDSQSSFWTSSSSGNSQGSQGNLNHSASGKYLRRSNNAATASTKSKSKPNRGSCTATKPPVPSSKSSLKWQQFFTLGLMKTPSMKLEDMRLRQQKPNGHGVEKSVLKRSVSCSYEQGPKLAPKEPISLNFRHKSNSVRENMSVEEPPKSRGWRMLAPLTALNGCKASTNSVINCSTSKMHADVGVFTEHRRLSSKRQSLYEDQNSPSSAKLSGRGCVHGILKGNASGSKVDPHKLSFS
ncbi:hypothetical protein SUGI_0903560 [Cryptomeria japonica]|nr:hypothetical protein SUGI_0903560 [Cryptomeria japonica]